MAAHCMGLLSEPSPLALTTVIKTPWADPRMGDFLLNGKLILTSADAGKTRAGRADTVNLQYS
jgi:hypothetical protein